VYTYVKLPSGDLGVVWIGLISRPHLAFTFWRPLFFFWLLRTLFGRQRLLFMNS